MIWVRSLIFAAAFYLWSSFIALAMSPFLLLPRPWMIGMMKLWARGTMALVSGLCHVRVEFRGLDNLAAGPLLIGAKHQCMFDTIAPVTVLADVCYVMRSSLMKIPFYGWYSAKAGMIAIDRAGEAAALRHLLATTKARLKSGRQVVIFPEGTRTDPGAPADYKPGVAALYRHLGVACTPLATNSGVHWPAHGLLRKPGRIVYEFLPAISPGLSRAAFMIELEQRLESASNALMAE